jgi:hypothetical protein
MSNRHYSHIWKKLLTHVEWNWREELIQLEELKCLQKLKLRHRKNHNSS